MPKWSPVTPRDTLQKSNIGSSVSGQKVGTIELISATGLSGAENGPCVIVIRLGPSTRYPLE